MTVPCTPSSPPPETSGTSETSRTSEAAASFEPQLVGFLCNWCTYTAADLAGSSRLVYPPNLRIVRMMCSGMVDPKYVLKSFLEGADGVLIGGCWPGDCHYINGNLKTRRRVALLHEVLERFGIERERLWLRWVAASEGVQFAELVEEMTQKLKALGPCTVRPGAGAEIGS
jgi:coenzyme F420-reducing hydrogenase delta subunit